MADQNHPQLKSLLKWKHLQQYYKITSICYNFTRNISYYSCSIIIIKICCNINSICSNFTSGFRNPQEVILRWGCKQEAEPRYIAEFASLSLSLSHLISYLLVLDYFILQLNSYFVIVFNSTCNQKNLPQPNSPRF